jgi:hypothetical protein
MQSAGPAIYFEGIFGGNLAVYSSGGANNYKLQGLEIDLLPQAGTVWAVGGGVVLNVFTMQSAGPAFYFEGLSGGKWSTGIQAGNLSDNGAGLSPAPDISGTLPRMGTLIDSGAATYVIDFMKINNAHKIRWAGTAGSDAKIYMSNTDKWRHVMGSGDIEYRDNADANTVLAIGTDGKLKHPSGLSATSATAGAQTLPANPAGFLIQSVGGTDRKIPYYAT